jgi:hypothetical protein
VELFYCTGVRIDRDECPNTAAGKVSDQLLTTCLEFAKLKAQIMKDR